MTDTRSRTPFCGITPVCRLLWLLPIVIADRRPDTAVTPEMFAQTLCDDFKVNVQYFGPKVAAAIRERVLEYQDQVLPILQRDEDPCKGKLLPDSEEMAVFYRARDSSEEIKTESGHGNDSHIRNIGVDDEDESSLEERPMTVEEATACLSVEQGEELRILVKVG